MELRELKYFLAIAEEGSITNAAKKLHITQPTLSRQMSNLENEFGRQLLVRTGKGLTLTDAGLFLRDRAIEIIELSDRTEAQLALSDHVITGDVYIGCGESDNMRLLFRLARRLRDTYPDIRFHIVSGNSEDLMSRLDRGALDFMVQYERHALKQYEYSSFPTPYKNRWVAVIRKDDELAKLEAIQPEDLLGVRLILSRQATKVGVMGKWAGSCLEQYNVVGTFNLPFNAALMVEEGVGDCLLSYDKLANTSEMSNLCSRPLSPTIKSDESLVWKKNRQLSRAAGAFLDLIIAEVSD